MKNKIQPITIDLMNSLTKEQRNECILKYQAWRKKVRKQDKNEAAKFMARINRFFGDLPNNILTINIYIQKNEIVIFNYSRTKKEELEEYINIKT